MSLFSAGKGVAVDRAPSKKSCQNVHRQTQKSDTRYGVGRTGLHTSPIYFLHTFRRRKTFVWLCTPTVHLPCVYEISVWNTSCDFSSLRRGSAAARLLGLPVQIPAGRMDASCEYCGLSGRGLCIWPITSPGKSYCVGVCQCVWSGVTITFYSHNK